MIVVIEYIKDYLEAFKTISDLLVKNGLFFGFFVNKESFWHKITRKKTGTVIYQEFNLAELKNIFHEIGLSISKIKYEGFRIPFINRVMSLLLPSANTLSYFSNFWNFIIPEKLREYIVIYATKKSN